MARVTHAKVDMAHNDFGGSHNLEMIRGCQTPLGVSWQYFFESKVHRARLKIDRWITSHLHCARGPQSRVPSRDTSHGSRSRALLRSIPRAAPSPCPRTGARSRRRLRGDRTTV